VWETLFGVVVVDTEMSGGWCWGNNNNNKISNYYSRTPYYNNKEEKAESIHNNKLLTTETTTTTTLFSPKISTLYVPQRVWKTPESSVFSIEMKNKL